MKTYLNIKTSNVPCWYDISWDEKKGCIILRIHRDFIEWFGGKTWVDQLLEQYIKTFKIPDFCGGFGSDFGFGGCLIFLGENSDFQSYAITIPKIIYKTERSCRTCQGSGVIVGFKCMYCAGTGFEIKHDYTTAYAISSSLALLFSALSLYDLKTSSNLPQLMTLNTTAIISSSGFAISGEYSMEAVRASSLLNRLDMNQINEAMRLAWLEMNDGLVSSLDQWHFYLNVLIGRRVGLCFSNGAICIIPEPESLYVANIAGYNFYSYEVDTPMQQLVLLVGLARLHDILRLRMQDATS
jgi:hypothetical protein